MSEEKSTDSQSTLILTVADRETYEYLLALLCNVCRERRPRDTEDETGCLHCSAKNLCEECIHVCDKCAHSEEGHFCVDCECGYTSDSEL
jgi:hypothetical protein